MRHPITLLVFAGAIAAYGAASMQAAAVLLVVGVVLESVGWYRGLRTTAAMRGG